MGNVRASRVRATPPRASARPPGRPIASGRTPTLGTSAKASSDGPRADNSGPLDAVLELQQTAGNQAVVQLLSEDHAVPPRVGPGSGGTVANRALVSMLAGMVQREGATTTPAPGGAKVAGGSKAAPKPAKPPGSSSQFASYAELVNDFQELAAAALNNHGVGLGAVKFGHDLNPQHRRLLNQVRAVLVDRTQKEPAAHRAAAAAWPSLAAKLVKAVDEARALRLSPKPLAAMTDDIALIGRVYLEAKAGKSEPEVESFEDYKDAYNAMNDMLWAYKQGQGEAGDGIIREEVPSRKDIAVSSSIIKSNAEVRANITKVQLGSHLNARHRKLLESLRSALIAARSEKAGSAYLALARWRSIHDDLEHILERAQSMAEIDTSQLRAVFVTVGERLPVHYAAVHQENLVKALTKERPREQESIDRTISAMGPTAAAAIEESNVVQDFKYALGVIESHVSPSPDRPNEYILTSGGTVMRIRADQALHLKEAARVQVKAYMASIVKEMVHLDTYDQIHRGTGSTRLHVLETLGGADDPGDQSAAKNAVIKVRDDLVYKLADSGRLVAAFEETLRQKVDVERRARAVP